MGTLTSSSIGHSSNDERWYDILDPPQESASSTLTPAQGPNDYHHPKLTTPSNSLPLTGDVPRPLSLHNDSRQVNLNGNNNPNSNANVALLKRLIINENNGHENGDSNEPLYSSSMKNLANHHHLSATEDKNLSRHNSPQLKPSATTTNIYGINGGRKNLSPMPTSAPGTTQVPATTVPEFDSRVVLLVVSLFLEASDGCVRFQ